MFSLIFTERVRGFEGGQKGTKTLTYMESFFLLLFYANKRTIFWSRFEWFQRSESIKSWHVFSLLFKVSSSRCLFRKHKNGSAPFWPLKFNLWIVLRLWREKIAQQLNWWSWVLQLYLTFSEILLVKILR